MASQEPEDIEVSEPPPKPPDKNKVDKDKQLLSAQIQHLEGQLHGCTLDPDPSERVQQLQTAQCELRELHRQTDERLQALAPRITETRHEITKLRDKLKYRTAQQVDDAVQRLEKQVQTHNFKLREEEKIVREINELKKSKRTIKDYDAKKRDLEALNQRQRGLRYERDRLYGEIDKKKREEERIHRETHAQQASIQMLNGELSELREQRQALEDDFQQRQEAWQAWQRRASGRRRRQREADAAAAAAGAAGAGRPPPARPPERRASPEPFRRELSTCAHLLAYLQKLSHTPGTTPATPSTHLLPAACAASSGDSTPLSPRTPQPRDAEDGALEALAAGDGMYLLRRKEEEKDTPPPSSRAKRRRERRGSQRVRPLTHSSEVFHQFCLLDLQPPTTNKEVPAAIEQLKAKQKFFQMAALKARQERSERLGPAAGGGGGGGGGPLTLRLASEPSPDELVTLHSIGVQLPYQLTMAAPASAPPAPAPGLLQQFSCESCPASLPPAEPVRPLSRDSGVPSAPLSADAAETDRDPFAEALQSKLDADAGAAQRQPQTLEVPSAGDSGNGSAL